MPDNIHDAIITKLDAWKRDGDKLIAPELSSRARHIINHYQHTWDKSAQQSSWFLGHLVSQSIKDLCRSNGVDDDRNVPRL